MYISSINDLRKMKLLSFSFITCHAFGIFLSFNNRLLVSDEYIKLFEYDGVGFVFPIVWPITVVLVLGIYLSVLAMCFQRRVGVYALVGFSFLVFISEFLSGIRIISPGESAVGFIIGLMWGGLLFSSFWLPEEFWKSSER